MIGIAFTESFLFDLKTLFKGVLNLIAFYYWASGAHWVAGFLRAFSK